MRTGRVPWGARTSDRISEPSPGMAVTYVSSYDGSSVRSAGALRPAPEYRYENVPTFFECGPRHLLVETSA